MQGFYSFIIFLWVLSIGTTTVLQAQKKGKKDAVNNQEDRFKAESHLTEGMKFYILDNYSNALVNFKKALALQPESPGIHYQMAETHIKLKNYDDALDHAEKALALDAENKHCYVLLARLHEKQGKFEKAAEVYERLLETNLTGINSYYYELALIYQYQLKDYKQALKTYEKIEQTFGMSEEVIQQKQQIYIQQGKLEMAIQEGTRLTDTDPKNPKYALSLAELFIANSQTDQAIVLLEKIARDNPEEYAAHAQANMLLADIYKSQGQGQKAATRIDEMVNDPKVDADAKVKVLIGLMAEANTVALKEEAYQLATQIVDQHPNHVQATTALADILLAQHQLKEARVYYEKALVLDNAQFELWYQVLQIDTQLGEADAMIKHAEQALELFPNQAILWLYSGTGYFEKRDYNTAFEIFELGQSYAISNEMLYNEFSVRLADCYNGLGQFEKADALYGEVLEKDPENEHALNNYTYYLALRGEKLKLAEKQAQKLTTLHPDNPIYWDTYAWVLDKQGNYREAKKLIEKALKSPHGNQGSILEHYGDLLFKLGQKEEAVMQWRKAKDSGEVSELIDKKIAEKKLYEQ